jgi:hypothetical protein
MADDWKPKSAVAEDDWKPASARIVVPEHTRRPRTRPGLGATVGGAIGGIAGTPGGLAGAGAGAGLGGMVGEGLQQGLEQGALGGPGPPLAGALLDPGLLAQAGGEQAVYEALGGSLAKGVGALGRGALSVALKTTPEVAQTAIREGITATRQGLAKLSLKIAGAGAAERKIVKAAADQGVGWVDPHAISMDVFNEVAKKLEGAPQRRLADLSRIQEEFVRDNPGAINPLNLLKKRQYYDAETSSARKAIQGGAKPGHDVEDLWNKEMGDRIRQSLRADIPAINDPTAYQKITGSPATPHELQQLREVAFPTTKKAGSVTGRVLRRFGGSAAGGATVGALLPGDRPRHALEGATLGALGAGLTHPATASWLALVAQNPVLWQILRQVPRTTGAIANQ